MKNKKIFIEEENISDKNFKKSIYFSIIILKNI